MGILQFSAFFIIFQLLPISILYIFTALIFVCFLYAPNKHIINIRSHTKEGKEGYIYGSEINDEKL